MGDVIEFPTSGGLHRSPDASTIRRGVDRLADAATALRRSQDDLARQHQVLGRLKVQLENQGLRSQAIAVLASSISIAIAAGDLSRMIALQATLKRMLGELLAECIAAWERGAKFLDIWRDILRVDPLVDGSAIHMTDGERNWLEVPLTSGDRLVYRDEEGFTSRP